MLHTTSTNRLARHIYALTNHEFQCHSVMLLPHPIINALVNSINLCEQEKANRSLKYAIALYRCRASR